MGDDNYGIRQDQTQILNFKQAIDQGFNHDIFYQLLATAEAYALGSDNPPRQFKGYEFFNIIKTKKKTQGTIFNTNRYFRKFLFNFQFLPQKI